MKISVIIPAYNEEDYIAKTLQSVEENVFSDLFEIIVVNNASTDATAEIAGRFKNVQVVYEPRKGLTRARQAGLNAAKGDILACIDADSLVPKNWFETITSEFNADPGLVFLSGPYIYYDLSAGKRWAIKWLYYRMLARVVYFFTGYMASGGNMVAKKEALLKVGGFDTNIEFYGEDTDIARRLSKVGKVKFNWDFNMLTSGRRIDGEGIVTMTCKYILNYTTIMFFKKPATKKYSDIR